MIKENIIKQLKVVLQARTVVNAGKPPPQLDLEQLRRQTDNSLENAIKLLEQLPAQPEPGVEDPIEMLRELQPRFANEPELYRRICAITRGEKYNPPPVKKPEPACAFWSDRQHAWMAPDAAKSKPGRIQRMQCACGAWGYKMSPAHDSKVHAYIGPDGGILEHIEDVMKNEDREPAARMRPASWGRGHGPDRDQPPEEAHAYHGPANRED